MEQNQDQSLFDMNMDSTTQSHLLSISKWTKFISITGFVIGGLFLLLLAAYGSEIIDRVSVLFTVGDADLAGAVIAIVLVAMLLIGFWLFFLLRASTLLKRGLQNRNTVQLADGFKAMRIYFVFSFVISILSMLSTLQSFF
ncbi:MAG: hypothetical protein SGI96_17910 [Bacteroidota bacterium]|nr:hypothetical protein [Bacteroidota bacterium]